MRMIALRKPHQSFLLMVCTIAMVSTVKGHHFERYKLYKVSGETDFDNKHLEALIDEYDGVDFWLGPANTHFSSFMLVPPELVNSVETTMMDNHINCKPLDVNVTNVPNTSRTLNHQGGRFEFGILRPLYPVIPDIWKRMIEDGMKTTKRINDGYVIDHHNYHDYSTISTYLYELANRYPRLVTLSWLANVTHEGRKVATLELHGYTARKNKPVIIVESGIHAREWIAPAAILFTVEKILQDYEMGIKSAKDMLDEFDWHIVPVANPDGYQYTHKSMETRLWRKNRRPMPKKKCTGVDLNRNFDFFFNTTGISRNCTKIDYLGPFPFSEPETFNIKKLFEAHKRSVVAYMSLHSFGQLLLIPYNHLPRKYSPPPKNVEELTKLTNELERAMSAKEGKKYRAGELFHLLSYLASGSSTDWAVHEKEGIFATAIELRPSVSDPRAFNIPPNEIVPTGLELLEALKTMAAGMNRTAIRHLVNVTGVEDNHVDNGDDSVVDNGDDSVGDNGDDSVVVDNDGNDNFADDDYYYEDYLNNDYDLNNEEDNSNDYLNNNFHDNNGQVGDFDLHDMYQV